MSYDPRNARGNDPETSHLGTAGIQPSHIEALVAFLHDNDRPQGWTTGEMRDALDLDHAIVWRRISDAGRDGLAEPAVCAGQVITRIDPQTSRAQRAWRVRGAKNVNPSGPVLWIDPGKMTGLAGWTEFAGFYADEYEFMTAGDAIERMCELFGHGLYIGWEHFVIGPKTPAADAHYAIEMIGVARRAALKHNCKNVGPAQPDQRNKATMAMLQAIGWWVPGKDDAQSAAQHCLSWMMRNGCVPSREATILAEIRSRSGE